MFTPNTDLDFYSKQANKHKLLTRQEERELTEQFKKTRDVKILNTLVERNLRFVLKIANEYRTYKMPLLDLVQEGNLGLIAAINKFEPDKGFRLVSYAVHWIRAYIQNYLIRNWSLVKMGTTQAQRTLFYKLRRVRMDMEYELNRPVTIEEVAERLAFDADVVRDVDQRMRVKDYSLDAPLPGSKGEESRATYLDMIEDEQPLVSDVMEKNEKINQVRQAAFELMKTCNPKERAIIRHRLLAEEPKTLQQIGEEFGVCRERARQLEMRIVKQLKEMLTETAAA